jgi:hypothetical protein
MAIQSKLRLMVGEEKGYIGGVMVYQRLKKVLASFALFIFILSSGVMGSSVALARTTPTGQDRDWRQDRRQDRRDDRWERERNRREEREELNRIRQFDRNRQLRYRSNNGVRVVGYYDQFGLFHQYGYYDRFGFFHRY